jgi:protoporphyrinogen/coproporphyrinogen III oxidase
MRTIAIVGGGISGLSALHFLKKQLGQNAGVTLYERGPRVGGNIQSIREDGFLFETGPNGFLPNPATSELVADLGLSGQLIEANPSATRRYVQRGGTLKKVPSGAISFIATDLLSPWDKFSLVRGLFRKNLSTDQSVYDYVCKRFGAGIAEKLVDPFMSGIHAGDIKRLHMAHAFPKFAGKGKPKGKMHAFKNGMGTLVERLFETYAANIQTAREVKSISEITADHIICTAPAYAASGLLADRYPALAGMLDGVCYSPVAVIGLGFPKKVFKKIPDGFGYLVPSSEGKIILGVLIESNVYTGRAPRDMVMLRVMMGGRRHPGIINDDANLLMERALQELDQCYGLKGRPVKSWVKLWPKAIPQYEMDYAGWCLRVNAELKNAPGLTLAGNYLGGISFNDCITLAKQTALC